MEATKNDEKCGSTRNSALCFFRRLSFPHARPPLLPLFQPPRYASADAHEPSADGGADGEPACGKKKRQCGTPDPRPPHEIFRSRLPPQISYQARRPAPRRASRLVVRAGTISSNDFKVGTTIELDNAPWRIVGKCLLEVGKRKDCVCVYRASVRDHSVCILECAF